MNNITSAIGVASQFNGQVAMASQVIGLGELSADLISNLLSLFDNPQHHRIMKITTAKNGLQEMLLQSLSGTEALNTPYAFELELLSRDAHIELKTMLDEEVLIELQLDDGSYRPIHGRITQFSQVGSDGGIACYRATIEPWLKTLAYRTNARIFQEQNVEQILTALFGEHHPRALFRFELSQPQKTHSYITQYNETDLAFVQRLIEQEGWVYYFEHSADPQQHTLVIVDDATRLPALPHQPVIRFHSADVTETEDSITVWQAQRRIQVGRLATQTFDYRQPNNLLPVALDTVTQQGDVPIFERFTYNGAYAHGTFEDGQSLVQRQMEALEAESKQFFGAGNCRAMQPGYSFEFRQHYVHDRDSAEDRHFRLLSVTHQASNNYLGEQDAHYENSFACIRDKLPFRPLPTVQKPFIHGPQTAIVVGPAGEVMHTDELARVRVQFHWDRYGELNEKSSCWIRVMQPWASSGFGAITLPRIGDEVVITFLDGDPDRPLITGSLYNQQQQPPWALPNSQTQSGFMSRSFRGNSDNAHVIRFDDDLGKEQLYVQSERNMDTLVKADETRQVGGNRTISVDGQHVEQVKKDHLTVVSEGALKIIDEQQYITLQGKTNITLMLTENHLVKLDDSGTITLKVGESEIKMSKSGTIDIKGNDINVTGAANVTVKGGLVNINKE